MPVLFSRRSQTLIVVDNNINNKNHHPLIIHEESTTSVGRRKEMGNVESATTCFCIGNEELTKQTALLHLDNRNLKFVNGHHDNTHTTSSVQQLNDSRKGGSTEQSCNIEASSAVCQEKEKEMEIESRNVQSNGCSHILDDNDKKSQEESHSHKHNNTSNGGSAVVVNKSHRRHLSKFLIHGSTRLLQKASGTVTHVLGRIEDLMFPPTLTPNLHNIPKNVRGGILLHGCTTAEEHYAFIKQILSECKDLHGTEGLKKIGFKYRLVPCELHRSNNDNVVLVDETYDDDINNNHNIDANVVGYSNTILLHNTEKVNFNDDDDSSILEFKNNDNNNNGGFITASSSLVLNHSNLDIASQISNNDDIDDSDDENDDNDSEHSNNIRQSNDDFFISNPVAVSEVTNPQYAMCRCHFCMRKLFHIETNQLIENKNRNQFIADGDMYEDISRLVQEAAFDVLIDEAELEWITIWEPSDNDDINNRHKKPIKALINSDHPLLVDVSNDNDNEPHENEQRNTILKQHRPTLFIFTGRGKVRAGIFSRQHLICNGMEGSTCLPFIREAQARNLNVFIIDPNINGDSNGYNTFQKTMDYWCTLCNKHNNNNNIGICRDVYILSHSASGGHLVRYLLEPNPKEHLLRYMKAVAFTDSTHNIQWTKKSLEHLSLHQFIQSEYCVYFRCGKINRDTPVESSQWYLHPPGEEVVTDTYWQHRFGLVKTMWAGTDDHSLTNWFAMSKIWEHFDKFLYKPKEGK